jgi:hypothetical protein
MNNSSTGGNPTAEKIAPYVLLAMTAVTGLVDAVRFLSLGSVFTANMTGNILILAFATAHVSGLSVARSSTALMAFIAGAILGGRIAARASADSRIPFAAQAFLLEVVFLSAASFCSIGYIQAGDNIDIQRHGGAVRLPSGKVIVRSLRDFSMPLVGKRHLLFLNYNSSTEDFDIVTGYQLEGGHTYKLDTLTHSQPDSNNELIHPLRDQGENEEQLLNRVKAIKPPNQRGNENGPMPRPHSDHCTAANAARGQSAPAGQ